MKSFLSKPTKSKILKKDFCTLLHLTLHSIKRLSLDYLNHSILFWERLLKSEIKNLSIFQNRWAITLLFQLAMRKLEMESMNIGWIHIWKLIFGVLVLICVHLVWFTSNFKTIMKYILFKDQIHLYITW